MKVLKRLFAMILCCGLFLCGSGFTNKYKDVQKIKLESNPTTGYQWYFEVLKRPEIPDKKEPKRESNNRPEHFEKHDKRKKCCKCEFPEGEVSITETFESDKNDDEAVCGAGGTSIFEIKGEKEGIVVIKFDYTRTWENKIPLETVFVTVKVNSEGKVKVLDYSSYEAPEIDYKK